MDDLDKKKVIALRARLDKHGATPAALGEPKGRQRYYFHFLLDTPEFRDCQSLLDVGCGYGDLEPFLRSRGWKGKYVGIDIVPELIEAGRRDHPGVDLHVLDLDRDGLDETFDRVTSIEARGSASAVPYQAHLRSMLAAMCQRCRRGISFNLFGPYVDYRNPVDAQAAISPVLEIVKDFTRRFALRNDYMPFEYTVHCYGNNAVDKELSMFAAEPRLFDELRKGKK